MDIISAGYSGGIAPFVSLFLTGVVAVLLLRATRKNKEARKKDAALWRQAVRQAARVYHLEYRPGKEEPDLSDSACGAYQGGLLIIDTTSEGSDPSAILGLVGLHRGLVLVPRGTFQPDTTPHGIPYPPAETPTGDVDFDDTIEVRGANDTMLHALRRSDLRQSMLALIPAGLRIEHGCATLRAGLPVRPGELLGYIACLSLLAEQIAKLQPKG